MYLLARIIEVVGITYVYEPTTTEGSRVPNRDCMNVFNPETKSMVCTTLAFSICREKRLNQLINLINGNINKAEPQKKKKNKRCEKLAIESLHRLHPFEEQADLE